MTCAGMVNATPHTCCLPRNARETLSLGNGLAHHFGVPTSAPAQSDTYDAHVGSRCLPNMRRVGSCAKSKSAHLAIYSVHMQSAQLPWCFCLCQAQRWLPHRAPLTMLVATAPLPAALRKKLPWPCAPLRLHTVILLASFPEQQAHTQG